MMRNILLAISGCVIALLLLLLLIRLRYNRLFKEIWRSLRTQSTGNIFTEDMVADLDEPVQRYFLHAIKPGTPLASCVELEMNGSFRLKPDASWLEMKASQIISTTSGFIWKANIGKGLTNFSGADYYSKGRGRTKFFLWDLIPLVDAQSQDIDRSAAGRLGAEYVWLPSALLPKNGVTWKAITNEKIQVNLKIDNELICLTLTIDREGKLDKIALPRWGNATEDRGWQYTTFSGNILEEASFEGYTIPAKINVGWLDQSPFFRSTLKQAKFD